MTQLDHVETVELKALPVSVRHSIQGHMLEHMKVTKEEYWHNFEKEMLIELRTWCLSQRVHDEDLSVTAEFQVPDGLWEYIKWRFFKKWCKVRYRKISKTNKAKIEIYKMYYDAPALPKNFGGFSLVCMRTPYER